MPLLRLRLRRLHLLAKPGTPRGRHANSSRRPTNLVRMKIEFHGLDSHIRELKVGISIVYSIGWTSTLVFSAIAIAVPVGEIANLLTGPST